MPGEQDELVRRVLEVNRNAVIVLNTGAPVTLPWAADAPAIVQSWFGGQEMANALADVLTGDADPGGRLPTTYPVRLEDNPSFGNFPGEYGEVRYGDVPGSAPSYVRRSWRGDHEEMLPLAAEGDPVSGNAARQLSDLVRVIAGGSPRFPNTLPSLADGVRVQEVLQAALAARESWAEVEYVC